MLTYYEPTDEFIFVSKDSNLSGIVTHEEYDYIESLRDVPTDYTFYELVEIYPTAVPYIKQQLVSNIKLGIDIAQSRIKLNFFNPHKPNFGITGPQIEKARSVPISQILGKIPASRKVQCLFHADKTPSMHIYKTSYYCFVCQSSGSTIDLVMKLQSKTFKEAVMLLAPVDK